MRAASSSSSPTSPPAAASKPEGKETFVRRLFDLITPRYDLFNRIASLGLDRGWRRRTVGSLRLLPEMRVLDLACGTGDLALAEARQLAPLGTVVGCDLSLPMLASARRRLDRHPAGRWHVKLAEGRAEGLPLRGGAFHAATIGFALRNVSDLDAVFRELHRVLAPGGRLALLEFGRPRNPLLRLGHAAWLSLAIPVIGLLTTGRLWPFLYLRRSILGFLPPEEVVRRLEAAGFSEAKAVPMTGGAVVLYHASRP